MPCVYDGSSLNGSDSADLPEGARPGSPAPDAPIAKAWLLDRLGDRFQLLAIGCQAPDGLALGGVEIETIMLGAAENQELAARYLGAAACAIYLIRPDQHIAARWVEFDKNAVLAALATATGND